MTAYGPVGAIHMHSEFSHDGRDSLPALNAFARRHELGFLGLTDHAEDFDAARFAEFQAGCAAASDDQVLLIPGLEFRFAGYNGLHLLALGLSRWIEPTTPGEFMVMAGAAARFTIVAHPILPRYQVPAEVAAGIDAIEVWNASYNTRYLPDPAAARLLRRIQRQRPELLGTAGLDQHDARNYRETRVILTGGPSADPLGELKAGRFHNRGRMLGFDARVSWSPLALGGLSLLRLGYDALERTQEAMGRWFSSRRRLR